MATLFTPEEQRRVEQGTIEDFYQLWTQKESVVKADGRGIYLPFNQVQIKSNQAFLPDDIRPWYLFSLPIERDYYTSLCIRTPIPKITIQKYLPFG
jgi:4'-phosphopantetheinyl transferase